jgi:hypothetical protein
MRAGLAGSVDWRRATLPAGSFLASRQAPPQAFDGQWFEAAFGAFHAADGPGGGVDGVGGLLVAQSGVFPQRLQLAAQDHAQHGGAAAWPGLGHLILRAISASPCAIPAFKMPQTANTVQWTLLPVSVVVLLRRPLYRCSLLFAPIKVVTEHDTNSHR